MIDFRGTTVDVGDVIVYVGRQDMKASLVEGIVHSIVEGPPMLLVQPTRSSNPLGQPTGKAVWLTVIRKIVVIRKRRNRAS